MTVEENLRIAINRLKQEQIEEPVMKSKRLLAYILNIPKEYLIVHDNDIIPKKLQIQYKELIEQLINGKPIQYIIGIQEFMGIQFIVNEDVLIPQPDTEILVEQTIKVAKNIKEPEILDLCTGSGAIGISLAKNLPEAKITASDISKKALEIAKKNDKDNRVKFIESDLFKNINGQFDIIVSNPPYIKTEEIKQLSKEVQNEPILALDGGQDGLDFYREIISTANKYLKTNGYLCLEIGEDQKNAVMQIIKESKNYSDINYKKDLSQNDRVIICKKHLKK